MIIRILPEAEHDLEIGADFYESQGDGLGRYFNDCLMADIELPTGRRRIEEVRRLSV